MELQKIKTQTTWQEAADALNANSQTIQIELDKASKFLGYYVSSDSLIAAHETGKIGDFAYVGTSAPFAIYAWDGNSQWYDTGATGGSDEADLSGFLPNTGGTIDGALVVEGPFSAHNVAGFDEDVTISSDLKVSGDISCGNTITADGDVIASSFIVEGASSNDILLGDGTTMSVNEVSDNTLKMDADLLIITDGAVGVESLQEALGYIDQTALYNLYTRLNTNPKQQIIVTESDINIYTGSIGRADDGSTNLFYIRWNNENVNRVVQFNIAPNGATTATLWGAYYSESKIIDDIGAPHKDGSYPQMSVGFAEHLVGDGTATEEEFSFRPTAGVDRNVETTTYDYDMRSNFAARIKAVKGNSVVWNQQLKTRAEGSTYTSNGVTATWQAGFNSIKLTGTCEANTNIGMQGLALNEGDKLFVKGCPSGGGSLTFSLNDQGRQYETGNGAIWETQSYMNLTNFVTIIRLHGDYIGQDVDLTFNPRIINLTQMFGAGNEPTTVEEFYARLPIGVDLNAYNEGEIVNANYGAIKTTGFNQYNGTYAKVLGGCPYYLGSGVSSAGFTTEEGGTTKAIEIPTNRLYTPSQNGYIYAEGSDICINLAWDEYASLNGTYKPYKPFERDLSWVSQYFPEGMRRAGSVSDEIRFNSTTQKWEAVQRVGVVDLGTLSWSLTSKGYFLATVGTMIAPSGYFNKISTCAKYIQVSFADIYNGIATSGSYGHPQNYAQIAVYDSAYTDAATFKTAMSGVMLNYELATPIVTEIEETPNLDYDVADYGTEELIVADGVKSAPFLGNIIYTPNAEKTLWQVPDILKRLTALEAAVASATSTTTTE